MNLVLIAEHKSDTDLAENRYQQLLDRFPNHALALKKYGALLASKGTHTLTLTILERAYAANPDDLECLLLLGNLYEKKAMWVEAIDLYGQAQRRNVKLARLAKEKIQRLELMSRKVVPVIRT